MEDYVASTIKAYADTQTYENSTRPMLPQVELDQFLSMLAPTSRVLDAGCAFGRDTGYMQAKGFDVKAIDLSPALISRARELYPSTEFKVADVRDTGFDDASFGGIWSNATLLHLKDEDLDKALAEFYRLLEPGGVLMVSLKKGEGTQQFVENFSSKSERFFNFKTHGTFLAHLGRTGFGEVSWHYVNERERYGADKRDLDWLYSFSVKQ